MQTTHTTYQARGLRSALGIWRDKKGSFEVRRQTPEHDVFIDSTPQQSQEDKKTSLTDRSARVWVPIIVKIEPWNDCTRAFCIETEQYPASTLDFSNLKLQKFLVYLHSQF
jgi:hypothetical protein